MAEQSSSLPSVRSIIREWNPQTKRGNSFPLQELPLELLLCIHDYLQPVDRVCFAFTSKALWTHLQSKSRRFTLEGFLAKFAFEELHCFRTSQRWNLLGRLETYSWKRCAGCVYLHSCRQFHIFDIDNDAKQRFCQTPGLIQLCPHYNLTHKKIWMV